MEKSVKGTSLIKHPFVLCNEDMMPDETYQPGLHLDGTELG